MLQLEQRGLVSLFASGMVNSSAGGAGGSGPGLSAVEALERQFGLETGPPPAGSADEDDGYMPTDRRPVSKS